jgi:hypothetical protein
MIRLKQFATRPQLSWIEHLPSKHNRPYQNLQSFTSLFSVYYNLGNLLFAQRYPRR